MSQIQNLWNQTASNEKASTKKKMDLQIDGGRVLSDLQRRGEKVNCFSFHTSSRGSNDEMDNHLIFLGKTKARFEWDWSEEDTG